MGWLYTDYYPSYAFPKPEDYVASRALSWSPGPESELLAATVLAKQKVGKVLYAAVEFTYKDGRKPMVWAAVILINHNPRAKDVFDRLGWKTMDETVGPYYYDCPKKILDLLTPTDNEHANEWRQRCHEARDAKAAKAKIKAAAGDIIVFNEPVGYSFGAFKQFKIYDAAKLCCFIQDEGPHQNKCVRLRSATVKTAVINGDARIEKQGKEQTPA